MTVKFTRDGSPFSDPGRHRSGPVAAVLGLFLVLAGARAANVTVDAGSNLCVVADAAFGIHTSVYDNQNGNASLPPRLQQAGVNTLRYPGGGYADIFHWSVSRPAL